MDNNLMPKVKLSESVGWSESGGRRWINVFKDYIPHVKVGSSVRYNNESVTVLRVIKNLSESGLTQKEILMIKGFLKLMKI
jgi:restriction system protein